MRVLLVHNRYQLPGGEDEAFEARRRLLESKGHFVAAYERNNAEIEGYGVWRKLGLAPRTVWNWDSHRELRELIGSERPDVAHFHNTFPLISPSAYAACRKSGVPVVQSLDNPRLLCPAGTFYRDGHLCEDCLGTRLFSPAVLHACYRESRVQSAVIASMLSFHQWKGTWRDAVDLYVVATEFYRRKFIEAGLPSEKVAVNPHFVSPDPGPQLELGRYALFVGRLAPEKGVDTLMKAWSGLRGIPLRVRGEGPLVELVKERASVNGSPIELVPRLSRDDMSTLLKGARFLVWPSEGYYETFGLVAIEAFACGVPVIASRIGAMAEVVADGRTGLCVTSGDPEDLAAKVAWAWNHADEMAAMGRAARAEYEAKYTAERNYRVLMDMYARAALARHPRGA